MNDSPLVKTFAPRERPSVLFVCVGNGGKSQMAAALMRHIEPGIDVFSAGTKPSKGLNQLSAEVVAEAGASMAGEYPKAIDPELLIRVDRVVVLGREAVVDPVPGMRGTVEVWDTDEPSERGIEGPERMRLIRDDIATRVRTLRDHLQQPSADSTTGESPSLPDSAGDRT